MKASGPNGSQHPVRIQKSLNNEELSTDKTYAELSPISDGLKYTKGIIYYNQHDGGTRADEADDVNDKINGRWVWIIPEDAPNTLWYRCKWHTGMIGKINIVNADDGLKGNNTNNEISFTSTTNLKDNIFNINNLLGEIILVRSSEENDNNYINVAVNNDNVIISDGGSGGGGHTGTISGLREFTKTTINNLHMLKSISDNKFVRIAKDDSNSDIRLIEGNTAPYFYNNVLFKINDNKMYVNKTIGPEEYPVITSVIYIKEKEGSYEFYYPKFIYTSITSNDSQHIKITNLVFQENIYYVFQMIEAKYDQYPIDFTNNKVYNSDEILSNIKDTIDSIVNIHINFNCEYLPKKIYYHCTNNTNMTGNILINYPNGTILNPMSNKEIISDSQYLISEMISLSKLPPEYTRVYNINA